MPSVLNALLRAASSAFILAAASLAPLDIARAGLFGPTTYDECITDSMKGVTSDIAARAIIRSCRERFPPPPPPAVRPLTETEVTKLHLSGLRMPGGMMGTIHNDNAETTVTRVLLSVTTRVKGKPSTRQYLVDVHAAPGGSGNFMEPMEVGDSKAEPEVSITNATGY